MAWLILIASGMMEAVWANALAKINGPTDLVPILFFIGGMILSMAGLAFALRSLPVGTAYAVWVGIGALTTCAYAMIAGIESISVIKIVLLLGIIGCVAGLKFVSDAA